jgi:hypothetical protein
MEMEERETKIERKKKGLPPQSGVIDARAMCSKLADFGHSPSPCASSQLSFLFPPNQMWSLIGLPLLATAVVAQVSRTDEASAAQSTDPAQECTPYGVTAVTSMVGFFYLLYSYQLSF